MTPSARLRAQAADLLALADELDGRGSSAPASSTVPLAPDRELDTGAAAKLMGCSYSTLYRLARIYGIGWRLPSGTWRFSERAIRAYKRGELGELGDAPRLPLAKPGAHSREE
jgi:hypothetical protein